MDNISAEIENIVQKLIIPVRTEKKTDRVTYVA